MYVVELQKVSFGKKGRKLLRPRRLHECLTHLAHTSCAHKKWSHFSHVA